MVNNPYDEKYVQDDYYWGLQPSLICDRVIELLSPGRDARPRLLDLGCGEGRNAVHFARHGFQVTGVDLSLPGLEKTRRLAERFGVAVETIQANILAHEVDEVYDVIFSTGTLHYLPPELRQRRFDGYKAATSPGGLNVMSVFVEKPFIPRAPDSTPAEYSFRSGELLGHYWDWEILYCVEEIFDCMSGGVPHRHAVNRVIARAGQ